MPGELDAVLVEADVVEREHLDPARRARDEDGDAVVRRQAAAAASPAWPGATSAAVEPGASGFTPYGAGITRSRFSAPSATTVSSVSKVCGCSSWPGTLCTRRPRIDTEALAVVGGEGEPRQRRDARPQPVVDQRGRAGSTDSRRVGGAQERLVGVALLVEGQHVGDGRPQVDAP